MLLAILFTLGSLLFPSSLVPANEASLEEDQLGAQEVECLVKCMDWCLWPSLP